MKRRACAWLVVLVGCASNSAGGPMAGAGPDASAVEDAAPSDVDASPYPPFHGRFGSPTIVREADVLHAYFPIQRHAGERVNITHALSTDEGATWQRVGEALPQLNARAKPDGSVWAPGAARIAADRWMLYYTATELGTEQHMCIYRAKARDATGPFVDDFAGPLECPARGLWAIDPYPIEDERGDWHLLARVDEPDGNNTISIRKLGEYGQHFAPGSEWVELTRIHQGGWEEPVMENAAIVRLDANGQQRWYVFYSGGSYRNDSYGVGYADCGASLTGPCVKKTIAKPWLASRPELQMYGPGTPTFYRDPSGAMIMALNTWKFSGGQENPKNSGQTMHLFEVTIGPDGVPAAKFLRMAE